MAKIDVAKLIGIINERGKNGMNNEGPGKPGAGAVKSFADTKVKEELSKVNKGKKSLKELEEEAIDLNMEQATGDFVSAKTGGKQRIGVSSTGQSYSDFEKKVQANPADLKKMLVKEGIFMEKDGDFMLTDKGRQMNKAGQLKRWGLNF